MTDYERKRYEEAKIAYAALMKYYPLEVMDLDGEVWRDIEGYEGAYQISNFARVKSLKYAVAKILRPYVDKDGYLNVDLCHGGKIIKCNIHRLVAETFIPNPENKPQVNHIDLNKMNNHVSNLEWVTQCENVRHANSYGTHKNAKTYYELTEEEIALCRKIYVRRDKEYGVKALAKKFGVRKKVIYNVAHNITYKHIQ